MAPLVQNASCGPIALLTDYGWEGPYAGVLKSVILSVNPAATVIDITHGVPPQAIESGAFILSQVAPYLPSGSIAVAVVDPGVGTSRAGIAVRFDGITFVGPDNGLISGLLDDDFRPVGSGAMPVALPGYYPGFQLTNDTFFMNPVSATFHGRDVFAPVAAHLSLGEPLSAVGSPIDTILAYPAWRPKRTPDGFISGRVIYVDPFGNLVTDIRIDDVGQPAEHEFVRTRVKNLQLHGIHPTFHSGPEYVVYVGSSGFLEIARRDASAAAALDAGIGETVYMEVVAGER
jgi:S-adenosylmethionine hydrolase